VYKQLKINYKKIQEMNENEHNCVFRPRPRLPSWL